MTYLKALSAIALLGAIAWAIFEPGFEPALAIVAAFSGLISTFIVEKHRRGGGVQKQVVSKGATGIQAGGDVHIGTIGTSDND